MVLKFKYSDLIISLTRLHNASDLYILGIMTWVNMYTLSFGHVTELQSLLPWPDKVIIKCNLFPFCHYAKYNFFLK